MSAPTPSPLNPSLQGSLDLEQARRWLYELCLFDLSEQQRIQRAAIARANGLNPLEYSQPMTAAIFGAAPTGPETSQPAPAVVPPLAVEPPDAVAAPSAAAAPVSPAPPPSSAPASPAAAPPPSPAPQRYSVDWHVDPTTGQLILGQARPTS